MYTLSDTLNPRTGSGIPARRAIAVWTLCIIVSLSACSRSVEPRRLSLATTTSVGNSGLLDPLLASYRDETGVDVRAQLVGSGLALKMLSDGHADVVISHAPAAESTAMREHPAWDYRKIMFNDFVLVGPPGDPAGVASAPHLIDAMRRIASSDTRFLSRGDGSGTHERKQQLWVRAGRTPPKDRLVVAGAGMGSTLRSASETIAYTLTDRATFNQLQNTLKLKVLFEGGPLLLNTYAVIHDPARTAAAAFAQWLSDGAGRKKIADYRIGNASAFVVWPAGKPRSTPDALPF